MNNTFKEAYNNMILEAEVRKKLDNFDEIINSNPDLKTALSLCIEIEHMEPNAEALIVGGSVRDIVLNKKPKDIDIATNVDIDKIANHFKTADIGKSKDFGIVAVLYKGMVFEVAHYREDVHEGNTDARHPSGINLANNFKTDSDRRDITINSLGLSTDGTIIDYQGGLDDIKNGVIKAVGKPKDRFIEDALRMMRVGRFMARYGFSMEPDTKNAIIELKDLIKKIAPERIREELIKSASSGVQLANYIEHLKDVGLLKLILPEIDTMSNFEHTPATHPEGNVFEHTMEALRKSNSNDPITNIAIMFHDLGKTITQTYDIDTRNVKYHGHEAEGVKLFDIIVKRLKFNNEDRDAITFAIEHHMLGRSFTDIKKSKLLQLRQDKNWSVLKNTIYGDEAARKHLFDPNEYETRMNKVEDITNKFGEKKAFETKMSGYVDGRMIMNVIPLIKGTDVGTIKNQAREWIIANDFNVSPDDVTKFIKHLGRELGYKV